MVRFGIDHCTWKVLREEWMMETVKSREDHSR